MKTLTADPYKRVRINSAKPGQVFACTENPDGSITLTPMKVDVQEPFPVGSLKKYVTKENNAEMLQILKGCTLEVPE